MTHRQILEALSGLLLGMFVAILSSTVVSNALPRIIAELGGGQSAYTWVVTSTLLAMTASTPLWGKLADLYSKKLLVQLALLIYVVASVAAAFSQNTGTLIGCRALQGIGAGGLTALAQVVMAAMISPRERGRYSGYLGAVFAVATVGGPLIGGVIVDTSWLGWRWCFGVGVPFALAAIVILQKTLRLPVVRRQVRIDWLGATLIAAAVSLVLIWVSLAGHNFDWGSWQTAAMLAGAFVLGALAIWVESHAAEPVIPLKLFRNSTITLATVASLFVGVAMFGATVFLSQYFQLARGDSPTKAGLMTLPLIAGLFLSSTITGRIISSTGLWKRWLVAGTVLITIGFALMGTMRADTPYVLLALYMFVSGAGVGMTMQNLVLSVQNAVPVSELGVASSTVAFFRSLGGAVGVSALGAVLGHEVKDSITSGLARLGVPAGGEAGGSSIPDLGTLPGPVRAVVEDAYGRGAAETFIIAAPFALLAFLCVIFIKEVPLRRANVTADGEPAEVVEQHEGAAAVEGVPVVGARPQEGAGTRG
ncbi:MDR family MFS transporter [Motilibacter aurantiacus]|uniref:MDR family MFS transporter n=1 Tax=Motilibacter aurantiacus TaxID=2714955 RepID=UPI001409E4BD|nr:MFS transporter [Motilibacter aurantiacus]